MKNNIESQNKCLNGVKVLIGPSTFGKYDKSPLSHLLETGCEIIENPYKRMLTKRELLDLLSPDVTGLIAGLEPLDREVLNKTRLKVISRSGSGLSNIDLEAAKELSIKVRYTPHGPTTSVAELTLGAMISLLRQIPQTNANLHEGKWDKEAVGSQLEGKTVVIIGFGRIGKKVASLLEVFNVKIIAVDPEIYRKKKNCTNAVEVCSLKDALAQADIVSIHCSGTKEVIGDDEFKLMKHGTFLLNAARGGVVKEESLIQVLENGRIRGAWIDTFDIEPYDGPLRDYPQVILTPHIGSYTLECRKKMEMDAVNNLIYAFMEK